MRIPKRFILKTAISERQGSVTPFHTSQLAANPDIERVMPSHCISKDHPPAPPALALNSSVTKLASHYAWLFSSTAKSTLLWYICPLHFGPENAPGVAYLKGTCSKWAFCLSDEDVLMPGTFILINRVKNLMPALACWLCWSTSEVSHGWSSFSHFGCMGGAKC